jgi:hypothetical protein
MLFIYFANMGVFEGASIDILFIIQPSGLKMATDSEFYPKDDHSWKTWMWQEYLQVNTLIGLLFKN